MFTSDTTLQKIMLSKAQATELKEWRKNEGQQKKKGKVIGNSKGKVYTKAENDKAIASAVEKKIASKLKSIEDDKAQKEALNCCGVSIAKLPRTRRKTVGCGNRTPRRPRHT